MQKNENVVESKCNVCDAFIMKDKIGNGDKCSNCGWIQDSMSLDFPDRVIGPNFVSLNKAKILYQKDLPLKPDFQDFIGMCVFYGEVEFTYRNATYGVDGGKEIDSVDMFNYNTNELQTFKSIEDFEENASIDGKLLKDIWGEVENADWLQ